MLFSGSVRANIDPFGAAEGDAAIWEALHQVGIKPAIAAMQVGNSPSLGILQHLSIKSIINRLEITEVKGE